LDPREKRKAEFLAKAMEAEQKADEAKDQSLRDKWLAVAASYRALANTT